MNTTSYNPKITARTFESVDLGEHAVIEIKEGGSEVTAYLNQQDITICNISKVIKLSELLECVAEAIETGEFFIDAIEERVFDYQRVIEDKDAEIRQLRNELDFANSRRY